MTQLKTPLISKVDDDELARDGIRELVESFGYEAVSFPSAKHFLQSDVIVKTTCLITDVQMPGLNGLEWQEVLQSLGNQTPVIVITDYPNGEASDPCARKRCGRLPEQAVRRVATNLRSTLARHTPQIEQVTKSFEDRLGTLSTRCRPQFM